MRTIVHLSDLHFGMIDQKKIAPLTRCIHALNPDLAVISGDLTQRATIREYEAAREFIRSLNIKTLAVPGNHDIPFYDLWRRVVMPFERFHRYISSVTSDTYIDDEVAVVGINTVQRFAFTRGRATNAELARIDRVFSSISAQVVRVVFAHHPIELPEFLLDHHRHIHHVVHGRERTMSRFAKAQVDVFLSGHLHVFNAVDTSLSYKVAGYSGVVIQAGTALSTRLRGEDSSFNVVKFESGHITVDHYRFDDDVREFKLTTTAQFAETPSGWKKI